MPNQAGRVFNAVAQGAEIKAIKGVGFMIITKEPRRKRRTKEEMKAEKNSK